MSERPKLRLILLYRMPLKGSARPRLIGTYATLDAAAASKPKQRDGYSLLATDGVDTWILNPDPWEVVTDLVPPEDLRQ